MKVPHSTAPDVVEQLLASQARFLSFLERRVASRADAEEILQEAFARAIERGAGLRDDESAVAWFYRLLHNAVIDHYRRRGSARRALEGVASQPAAGDASVDVELRSTVCACMHDLLPSMRPEYAEAIQRVDLDEGSVADYAEQAGITRSNAGVRLHRAREALFQQLVASCGSCAKHGCLDCSCKRSS